MKSDALSNSQDIYASGPWQIMSWLRRATLLLAAERCGIEKLLRQREGIQITAGDGTSMRLLRAGAVLGIFEHDHDGNYRWSPDYAWIGHDASRWNQLVALIRHQLTYLNLIETDDYWSEHHILPATQLATNPEGYAAFLRGVAASHQKHASWLAQLDDLKDCRTMIDVGGGLGSYAETWVKSSEGRRARIVDLPGVGAFLHELLDRYWGRIDFIGADLNEYVDLEGAADFVLFANVLHLFPAWPSVLGGMVKNFDNEPIIGIFEADAHTAQGALFDFQVHLRSGRRTGLIDKITIENVINGLGIKDVRCLTTLDPDDPFQREYCLWLGQVQSH